MRVLAFLAALLCAGSAAAQQHGAKIHFYTRNPSGPTEMLAGGGALHPIFGWLSIPEGGQARKPAMVIMHGSGGIRDGREHAWAARLNAMGIATFVVDSFTDRGIAITADDQSRLSLPASVLDAFRALDRLSTHPNIDPARIGVIGFSKGGQVALYSALEPLRRAGVEGDLRFALHIALYPSCSVPYRSREVTKAPMLFLLGGADDYTPAAHCARYAEFFRSNGAPVTSLTLPGAHHGFDLPGRPQPLARVQTARNCGLDIELDPVMGRRWDGTEVADIPAYLRECMRRGATMGGNLEARDKAIEAVKDAVTRWLKPG
ncbi:MAG TPA: dienelactone hydrolase family protein [Reyranellaceae bacterium]|nr:dienelactone hydrolase family protein [Reyranellaceae bacterium]